MWILGRKMGIRTSGDGIAVDEYKDFQAADKRQKSLPKIFVVLGIICLAIPLLLVKMWRAIKNMNLLEGYEEPPETLDGLWGGEMMTVRAKHAFSGETEMDLPIREGDVIKVIGKPFPEWWEGELNGRRGLFPSNFVEVVEEKKKLM